MTGIVFPCPYCPEKFESEENRNAHSLYIHYKSIPVCSTDLAEKEMLAHEKTRKRFRLLQKKLNQKQRKLTRFLKTHHIDYQIIGLSIVHRHYKTREMFPAYRGTPFKRAPEKYREKLILYYDEYCQARKALAECAKYMKDEGIILC